MRLYNDNNERLYINPTERQRFRQVAKRASPHHRAFALTLMHTGCRLSEVRPLTLDALQPERQVVSIRSLKKRDEHHMRELVVPPEVFDAIYALGAAPRTPLWGIAGKPVPRVTAYRWIKALMTEAQILGRKRPPKGCATALPSTPSRKACSSIKYRSGWATAQ